MTQRWIALGALALSGCYLNHGAPEEPAPAPSVPPPSVPPPSPAPRGPTCGVVDGRVRVEVRDLAPESGSCRTADGYLSGIFEGVEAAPSIDGIRITLDGCPYSEAPCPCAIDVAGVGADIAPQIGIAHEREILSGTFSERHVTLELEYACDTCVGCPCPRSWAVFHAAEAELERTAPPAVVTQGEVTCSVVLDADDPTGCATDAYRHALDVRTSDFGALLLSVDEGETLGARTDDGGGRTSYLVLRNLRSQNAQNRCTDELRVFTPAYVLWEEPIFLPDDEDAATRP